MALIDKMADRMLSLVVPKVKAGACACNYTFTQKCYGGYCTDCHIYQQNCIADCACHVTCGACYKIGPACC